MLATYVSEVPYARVKDINFKLAKKLKDNLDACIEGLSANSPPSLSAPCTTKKAKVSTERVTSGGTELKHLLAKINECKFKPVALSLIEPYSEQFIMKSRSIPTISDLFDPSNFDLSHPELQEKCEKYWSDNFRITGRINWARYQGTGERKCIFKHRAGHIGASLSWAVAHTNPAMPSQSLIKSISYPDLFKVTTKAISHGHKNESAALKRVSFSFKVL